MTRTVSERLADHVVGLRYEDIPPDVVEKTKDLLAYHLGLAFSGHFTDTGRHGVRIAHELSGDAGEAVIVGQRRRANPLDAIHAHAELITGGRWDEFHHPSGLHLSVVVHPVAWVLSGLHHRSGKDLLTAVIAGFDVACALADPVPPMPNYSRRAQNPFAPFGAAAVAARVLGFAHDRTAAALAQAGHAGMGVVEGTELGRSSTQALLARNGVLAALIARVGPPDTLRTIEGANGMYAAFFGKTPEGLDARIDTLGREFAILGASTKRYPGSGSYIIPIELTRRLMTQAGLRASDVDRVVATLPEGYHPRSTYYEGKFDSPARAPATNAGSLRFQLSILLLDGRLDLRRYERVGDPDVDATLPKIRVRFEDGHAISWARIEITTTDGRVLRDEADHWIFPKGDWGAWLREDGEQLLSGAKLSTLEDLLGHLEDVPDIAEVMACLVPDDLPPEALSPRQGPMAKA